jgi:hypothetical protein
MDTRWTQGKRLARFRAPKARNSLLRPCSASASSALSLWAVGQLTGV